MSAPDYLTFGNRNKLHNYFSILQRITQVPLLLTPAKTLDNFTTARYFRAELVLRVVRHLPLKNKYDLSVFAFAAEARYVFAKIFHFHDVYLASTHKN